MWLNSREAVIEPSAAGWKVETGPQGHTILINPSGRRFDVGETMYPDILTSHLFKLGVPRLEAEFLMLHFTPAASGASMLYVFTILPGNVPYRAADLLHHWEWWDSGRDWQETLFVDSDKDGIPELRDDDAYRHCGTVTYYSFDGKKFSPLWVEYYEAPEDEDYNLKLISRRGVQ